MNRMTDRSNAFSGMLKIGKPCVHVCVRPDKFDGKKWSYFTEGRVVILMAVAKGFAMVRRKGCMPYVCQLKELR